MESSHARIKNMNKNKMTRTAKKGGSYKVNKDGSKTLIHRTYATLAEKNEMEEKDKLEVKANAVKT